MNRGQPEILHQLRRVYNSVEAATGRLSSIHARRLQCRRGCADCCVDELTVFEVEAENIRGHYPELLAHGTPGPAGACAFLDDEGACRIYDARPYVCRTQGYPLRWLDESESGDVVELRDICPLNDTAEPVELLDEDDCWTLGPVESDLATLQMELNGGNPRRVPLRSLFTT